MPKQQKSDADTLELLSMFESGILTVEVNGFPLAKVDAESRSLDLEAQGIKECGIKLSKLIEFETGEKGIKTMISASESTARRLSERGWSLALYDRGSTILKMGRGVSRLTGHIQVNLLKLRKILENL
ncbi:MAG: hypothetical protein PXY39_05505 [archaeon]|nr:hypothetical protein [archaeon]